jgi:hypothetical protein
MELKSICEIIASLFHTYEINEINEISEINENYESEWGQFVCLD